MVVVEGFLLEFDSVTVATEPVQTWVRRLDWKVVDGFLQEFDSVNVHGERRLQHLHKFFGGESRRFIYVKS